MTVKTLINLLAILPLLGSVACEEPGQPENGFISAYDVTVDEGKTAQINAATNSTAPITYSSADETVATVTSGGEVTGIKAGDTSVTLRVEAVPGKFTEAEKVVSVTVRPSALPPTPAEKEKPEPGTYTFTASSLKEKWEAGDQIYIQGSYGPAAQVITLSGSQISPDGKTATAELTGDIFKYLSDPDPLYAVWPADAAQKETNLTGKVINFTKTNALLTQAYLKGNDFSFTDITSFISFSVSGGYDRFIITGKQRPGLRFSSYKNECSSDKPKPSKPKDDGYPFREEPVSSGLTTIFFPGGITFTGGFTIYLGTGDNWTASFTYSDNANLNAGKKLELGDITSKLQPYDGGKPHMPEIKGSYTSFAVSFNELSGLCLDQSGDLLWALGDSGEICQISLDGKLLHKATLRTTTGSSIDSEGLSVNYDTGDFLIGGEPNVVCRIPASSIANIFAESRFSGVESLFSISDAKSFGNSGAEGCTYYKDGLVYIGTQTGSYLYCCNLETGEVLWRKGLREMHTVITEIAGLCYDPLTDWLWVVDSESHKFFALSGDAEHLYGAYLLGTKSNEESICVDHKHSCVWIGDDYGSTSYVYKYEMSGLDDFLLNK